MSPRLRISGLDGLNAAPLQWGLLHGSAAARGDLEITLRSPAASAAALAAGQADVALIPSIELQRHPGLKVVPGICVAARRRVRSVILLARRPPAELGTVGVDETSRTSVALLRILLWKRFGVRPRLVELPPDPHAMLRRCDGALLIANAALCAPAGGWAVYDLAELWAGWTGLPFVFAVWAARPGVEGAGLAALLAGSRAEGMEQLPRLVAGHATRDGYPGGPALTAYLSELLHYNLGPEEARSLDRFFAEAHGEGLIPAPRPVEFIPAVAAGARALAGGQP